MVRKKKSGFLDKLSETAEEVKKKGLELGKITADEASKITEEIKEHGKDKVEEGISEIKKMTSSSKDDIELLEKLGKLKESGILTQKEFEKKKKEILGRI